MVRYGAMQGSLTSHAEGVRAVLAMARAAGLDGVELGFRADYAEDPRWSQAAATEAARVARDERVQVLPSSSRRRVLVMRA